MKRFDLITVCMALILWVLPILPANASELPNQAFVSGVVGHPQTYSLSCESRSAADWAAFWGVDISETEFMESLPNSDNPEKGFVGNPNNDWGYTPPYSYGVHAAPVAQLLRNYGLDAHAGKGLSWEEIRAEVASDRPVIVWVIGNILSGRAKEYTSSDGDKVIVAAFEHTMILVGYDDRQVHLVDAFTGHTMTHTIDNFLISWSVLGNMAIIGGGAIDNEDSNPQKPPAIENDYVVQPGDTLSKLASQWATSWQQIASTNQISYPFTLLPGQQLSFPSEAAEDTKPVSSAALDTSTQAQSYVVQPGEHLMQIARDLDMEWEELLLLNDLEAPYLLYPGDVLRLQADSLEEEDPTTIETPTSTTTTRYESLYSLAYRFDLAWTELAAINNIAYPYILSPGQIIQLQKE
jgi:uncharacterized protein YvpB/LysM repeat protein